ncbi:hypothetical protein Q1695_004066 [Nippostrongylus brasiliensis]|nr:hypothetical protein Q1695_004066 [Nippostrongylus brasiliensis]
MQILSLIFLAAPVLSANILFLNTWNSKSHGLTMKPLAERLASRGNNVTTYSMLLQSIGSLGKGVRSLATILTPEQHTSDRGLIGSIFWLFEMRPEGMAHPHQIGYEYLTHAIRDETFKSVMKTPWDIVILDELFASAQGAMAMQLREKYGTKVATFATTEFSSQFSFYRGFSRNPVTTPNYYTKGYDMMSYDVGNFFGRLKTTRDVIYEQYYIKIASNYWLRKSGDLLHVENSYERIFELSRFTFTDFPSHYGVASPQGHDLISVGEHCKEAKPLADELRTFVEDPDSKGTIYIAFGSIVITAFFDVINSIDEYRFIFSYGGAEVKNLKPHVKILRWAPQNDILHHHKTVLFFTHGGLKSLKEGVCSDTAMLFLPFFADQCRNALLAKHHGIAEVIYKKNITKEELRTKMYQVLIDEQYTVRTKKFHRQYLDHLIDPLDYGSRWVDRMQKFRDKDTIFYRNRGRLLSWISFLYLDELMIFLVLCSISCL